ncbi:phage tail protein [Enterococcus faecalis]
MLKKWAQPKISWDVTAADLLKLTDEPLSIDKLRQGTVIMINTDDFGSINLRIKKETKQDVFGAPQDIQLELGNLSDDFTTTMSDLKRKQEINETYSQGATNILNYSYQDNCEKAYPAEIEFFLDDDVFHVNTVELTFKTKRYRGYTKAVKGGGATVKSTSAGGASTQTSSAGGGSVVSSSAGGGGSTTSGSGGGSYQGGSTNTDGGSAQTSSANGSHDHLMFNVIQGPPQTLPKITLRAGGGGEIYTEARGGTFRTASAADNHTHTVNVPSHSHRFNIDIPAHSHVVSIPNHTHSISVPSHSHQVRIPAHTHQITLPDHSHPLEWGIYEAPSSATSVDIVVDGTTIPVHDTSQQRLNIVNYLRKTSGGKISRGNHTIKIIPNKLARIEAQVICRVFIQSQLGGQF